MKETRGCTDEVEHVVAVFDDEPLHRCPVASLTNETMFYLRLHRHYVNGHLACSGGILKNSNKYLRAMEIIDSTVDEINSRKREEHERKMKHKTRSRSRRM